MLSLSVRLILDRTRKELRQSSFVRAASKILSIYSTSTDQPVGEMPEEERRQSRIESRSTSNRHCTYFEESSAKK